LYQFHQWKIATIFQPSHVCARTRGVQTWRNWLGVYWLRNGSWSLYYSHWEGIFPFANQFITMSLISWDTIFLKIKTFLHLRVLSKIILWINKFLSDEISWK
jgi:hypothetical protein